MKRSPQFYKTGKCGLCYLFWKVEGDGTLRQHVVMIGEFWAGCMGSGRVPL